MNPDRNHVRRASELLGEKGKIKRWLTKFQHCFAQSVAYKLLPAELIEQVRMMLDQNVMGTFIQVGGRSCVCSPNLTKYFTLDYVQYLFVLRNRWAQFFISVVFSESHTFLALLGRRMEELCIFPQAGVCFSQR